MGESQPHWAMTQRGTFVPSGRVTGAMGWPFPGAASNVVTSMVKVEFGRVVVGWTWPRLLVPSVLRSATGRSGHAHQRGPFPLGGRAETVDAAVLATEAFVADLVGQPFEFFSEGEPAHRIEITVDAGAAVQRHRRTDRSGPVARFRSVLVVERQPGIDGALEITGRLLLGVGDQRLFVPGQRRHGAGRDTTKHRAHVVLGNETARERVEQDTDLAKLLGDPRPRPAAARAIRP